MNTPTLVLFTVIVASLARPVSSAERPDSLPLSELILYSSGVGYFERSGQVEGKASVDLQFKVDDVNDLLKSMVVRDFDGGQVSTVTYGSRDPLTKTLKSFGIDLTSNPAMGQILDQVRGERVEILRPNPLRGVVLGVEKKTEAVGENKTVEREYLNILTEDGLQSLALDQIQRIKFLNGRLNSELNQALQVLASGHDTQKKTVGFNFEGAGKRRVSVAYIAQTPVWKTTYRLVLQENEKPYLQGWAIVENTSDEDWSGVRLALVSGRPISFTMDLYQPLYSSRPVVQPELYTSLRPQVYGEALNEARDQNEAKAGLLADGGGIGGGGGGGGFGGRVLSAPSSKVTISRSRLAESEGVARDSLGIQSINAAAQGMQAGELFQYVIDTPVTLARQKSAMLPIVSQKVEGEKVSIYNEAVQAKYPLNGYRLKNSTSLHLMQGPMTVFDGNSYAGDARMEDLAPNQERLISYALDLKTEVEPQTKAAPEDLVSATLRKGTLLVTRKLGEEKTYVVRNRDTKKKTVLVEHPFRSEWQLVQPKEASERSREVYRFAVSVDPGKTQSLAVREDRQVSETLELLSASSDVIAYFLKARQVSPKVKKALEKAVSLRDQLNKTSTEKSRREQRVNEISQEQGRIRENMNRLNQSSDLYQRYVKKLDQQETELENLRGEIRAYAESEATHQRELNEYLLNLEVD